MPGWYVHGEFAVQRVSPGYFRTFGISLIRGRYLEESDSANAPLVTVINETMARKYWPNEDPVGQQITADMSSYFPKMTIVGVVAGHPARRPGSDAVAGSVLVDGPV